MDVKHGGGGGGSRGKCQHPALAPEWWYTGEQIGVRVRACACTEGGGTGKTAVALHTLNLDVPVRTEEGT